MSAAEFARQRRGRTFAHFALGRYRSIMTRKPIKCKDFYALAGSSDTPCAVRQNVMPQRTREYGCYRLFLCPSVAFR